MDAANDPMVDQLVVVTGTGMDSSSVKVGYYVREKNAEASEAALAESFWKEEFCTEGYCGHDGMSGEKREGDRRTPLGTYSFTQAFGSLENPGSRLPYKQLDEGDYWVDDGNSRYYNQMVNISQVEKDWNSAEHLIGVMPQYRYSLVLNYNTEERTPGKGSAIFLHGLHSGRICQASGAAAGGKCPDCDYASDSGSTDGIEVCHRSSPPQAEKLPGDRTCKRASFRQSRMIK